MIELGLSRISRLLRNVPIKWKACHVAGTNGKGSVCAYTSAMLHASNLKCGRFTSPHLIDRWDCITLGEKPVSTNWFHRVEAQVQRENELHAIGASEFEILTATAFTIFHEARVDVGVIEVGLGGSHDATNVLQSPAVTVITKIGLDHQAFLGDTVEQIAGHKAGIMKPGVPCLVDGTNDAIVRDALRVASQQHLVSSICFVPQDASDKTRNLASEVEYLGLAPYQVANAQLSLEAANIILRDLAIDTPVGRLIAAISSTIWPGRLHFLRLRSGPVAQTEILLDGAHNPQAARMLGEFVDERLRGTDSPIIWVVAISQGRNPHDLLRELLRPGDSIVATTFGPVDGMPWVKALPPCDIIDAALSLCPLSEASRTTIGASSAIRLAFGMGRRGSIVVAGSLYLISDVLRYERQDQ